MKNNFKKLLVAGAPCLITMHSIPVAFAESVKLEEVVVTAQRREQGVMSTPVAISVTTGEQLERQNVGGLGDLGNVDPSVQFQPNYNPGQSSVILRGVGTATVTPAIDQSVSVVLDGVTIGNAAAVENLGDIERVEILRGPQGTLFGKNASSGVISITTRAPVLNEFEGNVSASIGEREERIYKGVVNIPVSDTFAARIAAGSRHEQGPVENALNGKDIGEVDLWSARTKFLWQPSDSFDATLSLDYTKRDKWCCGATTYRTAPTFPVAPGPGTIVSDGVQFGITPSDDNTKAAYNHDPEGSGKMSNGSLTLNYATDGGWTYTSVTGYSRSQQNFFIDLDSTSGDWAQVGAPGDDYKNYSQEFRLTSPVGKTVDFVAGLYYYHADVHGTINFGYGQAFTDLFGLALSLPPGTLAPVLQETVRETESNSLAAFAQANWHLTDKLTLITGLRYTRDEGDLTSFTQTADPTAALGGAFPYCNTLVACGSVNPQSFSHREPSWRIGPQYQITDDILVYASAAKGYKAPGFNAIILSVPVDPNVDLVVKQETSLSYEMGTKARLWDDRVHLGVDVFYTEYTNYQAGGYFDPPGPAPITQIIQSADLTTKGVELDVLAAVTENLAVHFAAAYIDGEYDDFPGVQCYPGQTSSAACSNAAPGTIGLINAKGNQLVNSPKTNYQLSFNYTHPNTFGGLTGNASLNWNWRDDIPFSASDDPKAVQPAYGILGGTLGLLDPKNGWSVLIYGENLLNQRYVVGMNHGMFPWDGGSVLQTVPTDAYRRIGVKVSYDF